MALMHSNLAKSGKFDQFLKVDFMIKSMNLFSNGLKIYSFIHLLLFLLNTCLLNNNVILGQRTCK